jgi:uncharacterized damage-inducible protein DinB
MAEPSVSRGVLLTHFDYSLWASTKLLDACTRLSEEELRRDLNVSMKSILGTLQHIYYADRVWLSRLEQRVLPSFMDPDPGPSLNDLKECWPKVLGSLRAFVERTPMEVFEEDLHYRRLNGVACTTTHWKVLLHIVNHATLHRGQIMNMLRQMGHVPPGTDYIFYHLQL